MNCSVTCKRCQGTGKIHSPGLTATLAAIPAKSEVTASDVHYLMSPEDRNGGITRTNNCLAALEKQKLVKCVRIVGRTKFWKRVK